MAFLAKGRKEDLRILAREMGEDSDEGLKIMELRDIIVKSKNFDEGFVKELLSTIIEGRKEKEEQEILRTEKDRAYELERLRLELETLRLGSQQAGVLRVEGNKPQFELKKLIPTYNPKVDDMGLYLNLFERQLRFLKVPEMNWVAYLIGSLPSDVATLIARETDENAQNYEHVKEMLLSRFKLSAESFRQLFTQHRKVPESTWRDYCFELRSYFEGWLAGLEIKTFDEVKSLMIADQIKKRAPTDFKDHFLDDWAGMTNPGILADKLDAYDNARTHLEKDSTPVFKKEKYNLPKYDPTRMGAQKWNTYPKTVDKPDHGAKRVEQTPLRCYGCDALGYIKSKCPTCSPHGSKGTACFDSVQLHTGADVLVRPAILHLRINGVWGTACLDTGASHTIAGERLYRLLQIAGIEFRKTQLTISLANGYRSEEEIHTAHVEIELEGRLIVTPIIVLPKAKGNRTLLGADFLQRAGLVVNLKKSTWCFSDSPNNQFRFVEGANFSAHESPSIKSGLYSCQLREGECESLTVRQRKELDFLLTKYEGIFELGGEATPFMEHHIATGNHPPVSVPPYRMTPAKKELLGERVTIEHARGSPRGNDQWGGRNRGWRAPMQNRRRQGGGRDKYGPPTRTEYRLVVENLSSRVSWQDLKDYMRQAGEVTYADAHKQRRNEGVVEFASYLDMKNAIDKLDDTDLNGRCIKLIEDKSRRFTSWVIPRLRIETLSWVGNSTISPFAKRRRPKTPGSSSGLRRSQRGRM